MSERNPHCRKCRYRVWAGSEHCCDYIGITGYARQLICRIEDCTLWREDADERAVGDAGPYKGEAGTNNAGGKPPAHKGEAGAGERDASATPGRPIEGGARKVQRRSPLKDQMWPGVKELYDEGLCCSEIAARLGLYPATVGKWIRDEGLKPHVKAPVRKYAAYDEKIRALYKKGLSDNAIARKLGLPYAEIVGDWRRREGLPVNGRPFKNTEK